MADSLRRYIMTDELETPRDGKSRNFPAPPASPSHYHSAGPRAIWLWVMLLLPAVTAWVFVAHTHQVWEDFYITFRHTENLVKGNGLVYEPGQRVHGFTSVFNTLVPAVPLMVFGTLEASLFVYRLCSLIVLLAGLAMLGRDLVGRLRVGWTELLFGALLVATSVKIIFFTMNGQEAGFLVGFFALVLGAALRFEEPGAWRAMGLGWAGLLYTRPDTPLYIALVAVIAWSVRRGSNRGFIIGILRAGALATVCYGPWFAFAWAYYGTPVPHTVLAKAADSMLVGGSSLGTFSAISGNFVFIAGEIFGPIYGLGSWPEWLGWGAVLGGLLTAVVWVMPVPDRFARSCSFALFLILFYQCWLRVQRDAYPWYFGPATLLAIIVAGRVAAMMWSRRVWWMRAATAAFSGGLLAVSATIFVLSHTQIRIQQTEVEENTRKAIGLWLAENAAPGDSVYLEPIGYIGYYSRLKILDFPGLVSPEVVKARREQKAGFHELPAILKPKWIVARSNEIAGFQAIQAVARSYEVAKVFDRKKEVARYGSYPGYHTAQYDSWFVVLRRKAGR